MTSDDSDTTRESMEHPGTSPNWGHRPDPVWIPLQDNFRVARSGYHSGSRMECISGHRKGSLSWIHLSRTGRRYGKGTGTGAGTDADTGAGMGTAMGVARWILK